MKALWPFLPLVAALLGCQGAVPGPAATADEAVAISVEIGGVT